MKNFRTYDLALNLYRQSRSLQLPTAEMKEQFERAILSVTLNLAEGSGRVTAKDRRRFYVISLGSLREVQAIFDLVDHKGLAIMADVFGAHLYKLIQKPAAGS
jgi:four helix bundle protein